jgi:von Willebrand factor type A domain
MTRWCRYLALAGALFLLSWVAGWPAQAATQPAAASAGGPFNAVQPVNVVILADVSGSIGDFPGAIQGERQAASEIIQEEWSPQSQIAVYDFGSAPPVRGAPATDAVQQLCGLTPLAGAQARNELINCANAITPRTQAQGWNTDFAAALDKAENVLSTPGTAHNAPIVFILTDGMLDLGAPNPYAASVAAGDTAAQNDLVTSILPGLKSLGAQIWPVGFGQADQQELSLFASSGAQANPQCPARTVTPQVAIVPPGIIGPPEAQAIQQKLLAAFAAARCAAIEPKPWRTLQPGQSTTYQVAINPLTTFGSFVVNKGAPGVVVTYTDPGQHTITDSTAPSTGQLGPADYILTTGGLQSPQESLRLDGPMPGPWQVKLTNDTSSPQTVNVSVVWQGQVQPDATFSPQIGAWGQLEHISVRPAMGSTPVPAGQLAGVGVGLTVQWSSSSAPQQVPTVFDRATGAFTGTVRVPSGSGGNAQVVATIQADGVQGSSEYTLPFAAGGGLDVTLNIPPGTKVSPGGTVSAMAQVDNQGLPPANIVFGLGGLGSGVDASISSPSGTVHIRSGQSTVPVTIAFGSDTRLGPALGTIQWALAGQGAITPADWRPADYLDVNIQNQPTPVWQQWWLWVLVALVLGGLAGGLFLRRRADDRDRHDVQHVGVALISPNPPDEVPYLTWGRGFTAVRWFDVRHVGQTKNTIPRLDENFDTGSGLLELRRDPADRALLLTVHARRKADPPPPGQAAKPAPNQSAETEPPADEPLRPQPGKPFPLPDSTGLPGWQIVLTELPRTPAPDGKRPSYKVPASARPLAGQTTPVAGRRRISLGDEIARPRINLDDSLTGSDSASQPDGK